MPSETETVNAPELREVTMHAHRPNDPGVAVITKNVICTAAPKAGGCVRHIEFDVSGSGLEGLCVSGQSVGVVPPGEDAKGRPHMPRLYSLACPTGGETGDGKILSTTVKRTIDEHWDDHTLFLGVASNYLCDRQVGDEIRVTGPAGKRFVLPRNSGEYGYVFVATGTGIAPFRGMCIELLKNDPNASVTLIMGAPYLTDLLYHDFFKELEKLHPNFRYVTALSRQPNEDGSGPLYVGGRFTPEDAKLVEQLQDERTLIYVCGIAGMELGLFHSMVFEMGDAIAAPFVTIDDEIRDPEIRWDRKMMHKKIKASKRVFLEVYA